MKKVMFILPQMIGGGAERVAAQLANEFYDNKIDVRFLLTMSRKDEVIRSDLKDEIPLILLKEIMPAPSYISRKLNRINRTISRFLCEPREKKGKSVPACYAKYYMKCRYSSEIRYIRGILKNEPDLTVISFLQPTIPITLLAGSNLPNRVIISEREDPKRLMKKIYGNRFIKHYYKFADKVVFQTEYAKGVYPDTVSKKGVVIRNPLKSGLPKAYFGERNKTISTFCRISSQKNLPLLVDSFAILQKEYPDYRLRIIGNAFDNSEKSLFKRLHEQVVQLGLCDNVSFEPFSANVHQSIIKDAMYVNSSDYEGLSNAMLEAMAIGMPVICTDCDGGGARATIDDGVNGLLVPKNDVNAMYEAMKKIVEDKELAQTLSQNASKIREELTLNKVAKRWMSLI